jgi:hypothetical protein
MKENKVLLTRQAFFDIDECKCGKTPFRFHNTSKNIFTVKCNNTKEEFDIKTKKWNVSKKQPCDLWCEYHDTRPIFDQVNKAILKSVVLPDKDKTLEEKLRLLFRFVFVSNHTSTLDEINILVKNKLKREPRKVYYFPSIGHMRISHYETLEEYRDRIFSKKIIDLSEPVVPLQPPLPPTPPLIVKTKQKIVKEPLISKFIVVSDDDQSEKDPEEEFSESEDNDSDRGLSDYEDKEIESNDTETYSEEENYDEYDGPNECNDYD